MFGFRIAHGAGAGGAYFVVALGRGVRYAVQLGNMLAYRPEQFAFLLSVHGIVNWCYGPIFCKDNANIVKLSDSPAFPPIFKSDF